jgi:hypothetical protein
MASRTGYGKIPTSGLRLFYDIGDTDTSFKGKPTTNFVTNASTMANFGNYSCGTPVTFTTEFGTTGYRILVLGMVLLWVVFHYPQEEHILFLHI